MIGDHVPKKAPRRCHLVAVGFDIGRRGARTLSSTSSEACLPPASQTSSVHAMPVSPRCFNHLSKLDGFCSYTTRARSLGSEYWVRCLMYETCYCFSQHRTKLRASPRVRLHNFQRSHFRSSPDTDNNESDRPSFFFRCRSCE